MDDVAGNRPGDPGSGQPGNQMEDAVKAAAVMAEETKETGGLGQPGRPVNRRSPFFIGLTGAAGVAVTYGIAEAIIKAGSVLILVGMAFFGAAGLEPVVAWLTRHRVPRWAGVIIVVLCLPGIAALFLALAIPRLAVEATALAHALPTYLHRLRNHNSELASSTRNTDRLADVIVVGDRLSPPRGPLRAGPEHGQVADFLLGEGMGFQQLGQPLPDVGKDPADSPGQVRRVPGWPSGLVGACFRT